MSETGRIDTATTAYRLSVADNRGGPTLPTLKLVERMYIEAILEHCQGNKMRAARILGIDRRTLYRHLERWEKKKS